MNRRFYIIFNVLFALILSVYAADPVVAIDSNASGQRPGSKFVDVVYSATDPDGDDLDVCLEVCNGTILIKTVTGLSAGINQTYSWNAESDWNENTGQLAFKIVADDGQTSVLAGGDPTAISWEVVNDRWVKNTYANGHVTMSDKLTGRMWLYNASFAGMMNWYNANQYCGSLTYAGHDDWKLPSKDTLLELVTHAALFSNVQSQLYWSSTVVLEFDVAYAVSIDSWSAPPRSFPEIFVWPVRTQN